MRKIVELLLAVIILISLISSCAFKREVPETFYYGITMTDDVGTISLVDSGDWQDSGIISNVLFYPNPFDNTATNPTLRFDISSDQTTVSVDIYRSPDERVVWYEWTGAFSAGTNSRTLVNTPLDVLEKGRTYRVFLRVESSGDTTWGDILIQ